MQKKIKTGKSLKKRVKIDGWIVTDMPEETAVSEQSELYQVVQPKVTTTEVAEGDSNSTVNAKGKKKLKNGVLIQRSEASQNISEFNLTEVGKEKVKLNELIKTSQQVSGQVSVKKQLENAKKLKSLSIPLSKPQLEKIKRTIAYDKVCDEVTKWEPVVQGNRVAEQIIYPLKKPALQLESFDKVSENFVTKHPVEVAVEELLNKSENKLDNTKTLTAAEEKALQAMSLEEAKLRHKELMKHRALISYKEMKARRQNKIKSKSYHRILKKERMKKLLKEFEALQNTDASAAVEKLMEADKLRVMERMTLKHRNTGKWAKIQKLRAKYNPEARSVLKEDINIGKELKNKLPEIENQMNKLKSRIESEMENEADMTGLVEEPELLSMDDLEEIVLPMQLEPEPLEATATVSLLDKFSLEQHLDKVKTPKIKKLPTKPSETTSDFVDMEFISKANVLDSYHSSSVTIGDQMDELEGDDQSDDSGDEGVKNVSEAFADEEIIAEFREDKRAAEEASKPKGIDLYLPGWGSWGGAGIKESKKKRKQFYIKPLEDPAPKKPTLGNVIVNEDADKKVAAHQVSNVPFPFTNVHQFQSYIRQPIGHTWNPQSSFQNLTAPKVITKMGKVIEPIDAEDVVLGKGSSEKKQIPKRIRRGGKPTELKAF